MKKNKSTRSTKKSTGIVTSGSCWFCKWFLGILIADDELAASILFFNPHTTISQNLGWALQKGNRFAKAACWLLTAVQNGLALVGVCGRTKNHCLEAVKDFPPLSKLTTDG